VSWPPESDVGDNYPWRNERYVVVDVEGNGAHPPEMVELGYAEVVGGAPGASGSWLIRPRLPVTAAVCRIHGISNAMLQGAPILDDLQSEIARHLGGGTLVAHSSRVETDVLGRQLPTWRPHRVVDTMQLARLAWPGFAHYSLAALRDELGLARDGHRALPDALTTRDVFLRALTVLEGAGPLSVAQLAQLGRPRERRQANGQTAFEF
jgi:DNA polymerase III epsilon subunit-like protein